MHRSRSKKSPTPTNWVSKECDNSNDDIMKTHKNGSRALSIVHTGKCQWMEQENSTSASV